jgi:hypothetical protein
MTKRMVIALCAALVLAGLTRAQKPAQPQAPADEAVTPPVRIAPGGPAFASGWDWVPGGSTSCWDQQCWVRAEYLFSWFRAAHLPPLVTTSPPGTDRTAAGVPGRDTTSALFDGRATDDLRPGFRLEAGYCFGPDRTLGVEAGTMVIGSQATLFDASSTGTPILARPYFDVVAGSPQAALIAFPGVSSGTVAIRVASGALYEAHLHLTEKLIDTGSFRLNPLVGYRFYRYDEHLRIAQNLAPTGPSFVPGTQLASFDDFGTQNEFHGVDMGFRAQFFWQNLSVDLLAKVAVGCLRREVNIVGNQVASVPGAAPVVQTGGLYALTSNIGNHSDTDWGFLPELGVSASWQFNENLRLRLGYSILWLGRVSRAADQIDLGLNPNLFPPAQSNPTGDIRPAFTFKRQDVWVQNVSIGLEFTY